MSDRRNENCIFGAATAVVANSAIVRKASKLRFEQINLQEFILGKYENTTQGLISDLRRFGLVNVVALSLLMGLVIFRNRLNWSFAAFSVAMTSYTVWAAYGYFFKKNWHFQSFWKIGRQQGIKPGWYLSHFYFYWLFLKRTVSRTDLNIVASILPG